MSNNSSSLLEDEEPNGEIHDQEDHGYESETATDRETSGSQGMSKGVKIAIVCGVVVIVFGAVFAVKTVQGRKAQNPAGRQFPQVAEQWQPPQAAPRPTQLQQMQQPALPQPASSAMPGQVPMPGSTPMQVGRGGGNDYPVATRPFPPDYPAATQPVSSATAPNAISPDMLQKLASREDALENSVNALTAQVTRLEQMIEANNSGRPAAIKPVAQDHEGEEHARKRVHRAAVHHRKKVAPVVEEVVDVNLLNSSATQKPAVKAAEKPVDEKPKVTCNYLGGLGDRAWISCGGQITSVTNGNNIEGYGEVTKVDSLGGFIVTAGGKIN
jgi:hypothetical protein